MSNTTLSTRLALVAAALAALAAGATQAQQANTGGSPGTISGRVTDADGRPVAGERVTARSTTYVGPGPAATATTGADGRYTLRVDTHVDARLFGPDAPADRTFTVAPAPSDQLYAAPADRAVTLAGGPASATGVDFVVTVGPQITVRVHGALTGKPVPGVRVEYPSPGGGNAPGTVAGVTDAQGQTQFRTHALNVNLQIRPGPDLQPLPGENLYKYALLSPLQEATWDVTLSDAHALADFAWRGAALGPDGRPVPGALVRLLRNGGFPQQPEAVTDDAGHFTFTTAPPATITDVNPRYTILLADKGDLSAVASAPFEVTGGAITLRLKKTVKATVTGLVTDPAGAPQAGVPIRGLGYYPFRRPDGTPSDEYSPWIQAGGATDAAGRFALALPPGAAWSFDFGGPPQRGGLWAYGPARYPARKTGGVMPAWLRLTDGGRLDIGRLVVPHADAAVAGRVVGPDGSPVPAPLTIRVRGDESDSIVTTGADGAFRADHLVREPLTLSAYRTHSGSSSLDETGPDLILQRPVTAGDTGVRVAVPALPAAPFPPVFPPPPPPPAKPAFQFDYATLPGVVFVGPAKAGRPVPDEAAAVRAAQAFLQRIGEPGAVAVEPGERSDPDSQPKTWHALTSFSPALRLTLAADTGGVTEATDMPPAVSGAAPLTRAQAIRRGAAILQAAGSPRGYLCTGAFLSAPGPYFGGWNLFWMAQYHGIPFSAGGYLTERLDERTGRLLELHLWNLPPAPATGEEKVNAAGAVARADALLDTAGVPPGPDKAPFKLVVVANGAWGGPTPPSQWTVQGGDLILWKSQPARVAWIVQRPLPAQPPGAEVWVDAQTGAILGGLRPPSGEMP